MKLLAGPRWGALLVVGALAATACGTTVDPARLAAVQQDPGGGLGPPLGTTTPIEPGATPPGPAVGGPGPDGVPTTPGVDGAPAPDGPARGVHDGKMQVGIIYVSDQDSTNQAVLGPGEASAGDEQEQDRVLIRDLNKRGGIAGNEVVPVWYAVQATSNQTIGAQLEGACQWFTRDHEVYAVMGLRGTENFLACMDAAGVPDISSEGFTNFGASTFTRYPGHVEPSSINLDRQAGALVEGLARGGYFTAGAKLGVITYDSKPWDQALRGSLLPALARHGFDPDDVVVEQVSEPQRASDLGGQSAEASAAVLQFADAGVTHLIVMEEGGTISIFFMSAAQTQDYHPRYGLTSQSGGQALIDIVPGAQLEGALGIGWLPTLDLGTYQDADNPAAARCLKLMADGGHPADSANAAGIALGLCSDVWFLEAAVEAGAGGSAVTAGSFPRGLAALGSGFASPHTLASYFDGSHGDGVARVVVFGYVADCACFQYRGAPFAVR